MTDDSKIAWGIALAGLRRFYAEGMNEWSKSDFVKLFHNDMNMAESNYVQNKLKELSESGEIRFVDTDELYFVIQRI